MKLLIMDFKSYELIGIEHKEAKEKAEAAKFPLFQGYSKDVLENIMRKEIEEQLELLWEKLWESESLVKKTPKKRKV